MAGIKKAGVVLCIEADVLMYCITSLTVANELLSRAVKAQHNIL